MARGPAPTPTKILKARGSWRAQARKNEPELPVKSPTCPAWLAPEAKAEWRRQVKLLEQTKLIAEVDRAALTAYCEAWAEFVQASGELAALGSLTTETESGYILPHPLVAIKNNAVERLTKIGAQFGFSPASRARLQTSGGEEKAKDGKARFFQAG